MGTVEEGAYTAIHDCIRLQPGEVVSLITDEATLPVSRYLIREAERVSPRNISTFVMEAYGSRDPEGRNPIRFPSEIGDQMRESDVSIYAAGGLKGELQTFRMPMTKIVDKKPDLRHAHMANLNYILMTQGLCVDYNRVRRFSEKVKATVENARWMRVTSPAGTDFTAEFDPNCQWFAWTGLITPKNWMNLPEGEVLTCVKTINGVAVIDGIMGDDLDRRYGLLDKQPVTLKLNDGRVSNVSCPKNLKIQRDIEHYMTIDENANRIGELSIGTLVGIEEFVGFLAQDEKKPGTLHIAFGDGLSHMTGVDWKSEVHVDCLMRDVTIYVEDWMIMKDGKFLI